MADDEKLEELKEKIKGTEEGIERLQKKNCFHWFEYYCRTDPKFRIAAKKMMRKRIIKETETLG